MDIQSLRPFVGAKDFDLSKAFYRDLGWETLDVTPDLADMSLGQFNFFLQRYYDKTWCENTVVHVGVDDAAAWKAHIDKVLEGGAYGSARAQGPVDEGYALVTQLIDPSGVLWLLAQFKQAQ